MIPVAYDGHVYVLDEFWVGLYNSSEARKRGLYRLTTSQMKEFYLETNIPKDSRDDGELLDPTYKEM